MNRCITYGKIVTKPKAQNTISREGHNYLVCCPMCAKEFNRNPDHYIAVAESVMGEHAVKAYSQTISPRNKSEHLTASSTDMTRLIRNLKEAFDDIQRSYTELNRNFDGISRSGGLEGLRKSLREHRELIDSIQDKINVHAGVCRFVLSVAESSRSEDAQKIAYEDIN